MSKPDYFTDAIERQMKEFDNLPTAYKLTLASISPTATKCNHCDCHKLTINIHGHNNPTKAFVAAMELAAQNKDYMFESFAYDDVETMKIMDNWIKEKA